MINIAIIGCGDMGVLHARALKQLSEAKIYACCDLFESKAAAFADQFQAEYFTNQPERIFNDPAVVGVYLTTTTDSHLSLFSLAVKSGKHIFLEKPLAVSIDHAKQIAALSGQNDLVQLTAFKFRFYEMVAKARQLIPDPFMVSVQIMDDPWDAEFWANDPIAGGGNVISQGVHGADLLHFLVGVEPEQVFAVGDNYHQPTGVIDNLSATFRFANGSAGSLVVGDSGTAPLVGKFMVQMHGKQGSVMLVDRLTRLHFKPAHTNTVQFYQGEEDGVLKENAVFIDIVNGAQQLYPTIWDGFRAQLMIDVAIRSAQSRRAFPVLCRKNIEKYN
ncbi:MAG: Gfo/Idh/MocA family oxidoreductase [bacterium]|nr:Gfo/Idh/MocA family oxidoreductase [bacterium]